MNAASLCVVGLLCACRAALAQVPDSGRWQELRFSADAVNSQAEDQYLERVVDLAAAGRIDNDRVLLARLAHISAALIGAAVALKPEAAGWEWEVHTTSDDAVEASCMAGGKILVGSAFVRKLDLNDGELATLLGHEIAHALAEHQREELSEALFINPQPGSTLDVISERLDSDLSMQIRLSALSYLQEREADQLGMLLAHRAGWPSGAMVSFYTKLAAQGEPQTLSRSHPSGWSRVRVAEGMARLLAH